ncbi:phosphopyruvate hydratase [bacterium]|nr:MAG: phosphopyruvate hydratase [bacterium]
MSTIGALHATEILDSRGRPTVKVSCTLAGGAHAAVSVPSGASTGRAEARELRDGDPARYGGLGCRKAVANVETTIATALRGRAFAEQPALDRALLELDGTADKSRLGANAMLGVSLAFARAQACERGLPLYRHFADLIGTQPLHLPRLTVNLFSGGKHAGGQVAIQDVLLVPGAATIDDGLAALYAVYQAAAALSAERYHARALTADEGGLAPPFEDAQAMLATAVDAIARAGLRPGVEMSLALDVASSHFYRESRYELDGNALSAGEMIARIEDWVRRFPIVSVEDGLAEDDWEHWPELHGALHGRALTLGDDLLCTNPARIRRAVAENCADALLLKVNQIGTLSEAADAYALARAAGWRVTVSARSGETEDDWLADLAVGWSADQIKVGSITHSERLAKYNRLLEIERETRLPTVAWPSVVT